VARPGPRPCLQQARHRPACTRDVPRRICRFWDGLTGGRGRWSLSMTTTKSAPAAENGEGADNTEARTNKDTASTAGEQVDEQVEDDSSKTEQTPAAPGEPQAEPAAEEKKKDITQTYPES